MVDNGLICRSATNTLKPHNEDAHGWEIDTFWVIDGSTPITSDGHVTVFRFVELLNEAIKEELRSDPGQPLVSHIQRAHQTVLRYWPRDEAVFIPTASIIAAKVAPQEIQFYALGDCTAYVEIGKRTKEVMDPQFRGRESQLLNQVRIDMERGTPAEAAYSSVEVGLKRERRLRNTDDGKWILGEDSDAALHGYIETLQLPTGAGFTFALMTDGYRRALDTYELYSSSEDFLDAISTDPEKPICQIRRVEKTDPLRTHYIRFSAQDDATVVCVSRGGL